MLVRWILNFEMDSERYIASSIGNQLFFSFFLVLSLTLIIVRQDQAFSRGAKVENIMFLQLNVDRMKDIQDILALVYRHVELIMLYAPGEGQGCGSTENS